MKHYSYDRKDINKIVKQTVKETLTGLGFDIERPQHIQSDLLYLRKIRRGSEEVSNRIRNTLLGVTVPTLLYLLWEAFKRVIQGE